MRLPKKLVSTFDSWDIIVLISCAILSLAFMLTTSGCSNLPPKPKGTVWIVDYPRSEIVGAPFGQFNLDTTDYWSVRGQLLFSIPRTYVERKPLSDANKYICFDPDTWERFDAWVKEVQKEAERRFDKNGRCLK